MRHPSVHRRPLHLSIGLRSSTPNVDDIPGDATVSIDTFVQLLRLQEAFLCNRKRASSLIYKDGLYVKRENSCHDGTTTKRKVAAHEPGQNVFKSILSGRRRLEALVRERKSPAMCFSATANFVGSGVLELRSASLP